MMLRRLGGDSPRYTPLAVFLALSVLPVLGAWALDPRQLHGLNVWTKPLKFQFALLAYLLTLAWFARFAPGAVRQRRSWVLHEQAIVWAVIAEMVWIGGAAAWGTASHFNQSTPWMGAVYGFMGVAAILLTTGSTTLAVAIQRNPDTGLSPLVKSSLVWGLGLTLPLTLVTAGTMSSMSGHWVGGTGSDSGGLPLMGWSREAGDLRVAHFFATHAMHAIPFMGWAWARLGRGEQKWMVIPLSVLYSGLVVATFVQALSGRPFV